MPTTFGDLKLRVRQRTDNEHTGNEFIDDDELGQLINTSYRELYSVLVRNSLQRTESQLLISPNGTDAASALPADFYSLIGVWRRDGNSRIRLQRFSDRFRPNVVSGNATMYRIQGGTIVLYPTPPAGTDTYECLYIPTPSDLVDDAADTVDGVLGWEEFIVIDVAIKVLQKEESDTSDLQTDRARILRRIEDECADVELTEGLQIEDVRGRNGGYVQADPDFPSWGGRPRWGRF